MAVIRWYQSVQELVHDFDLDVRFVEHLGAVHLFQLLVPRPFLLVNGPVLLELLLDAPVGLVDISGEGASR